MNPKSSDETFIKPMFIPTCSCLTMKVMSSPGLMARLSSLMLIWSPLGAINGHICCAKFCCRSTPPSHMLEITFLYLQKQYTVGTVNEKWGEYCQRHWIWVWRQLMNIPWVHKQTRLQISKWIHDATTLIRDIAFAEWNLLKKEGVKHNNNFTWMHWKSLPFQIWKHDWSALHELDRLLSSLPYPFLMFSTPQCNRGLGSTPKE